MNKPVKIRIAQQMQLIAEINAIEINMVDCGNCGITFLHRCGSEELTCPHCLFTDDISSFPDTFFGDQ